MPEPISFDDDTELDRLIRASVRELAESYGDPYWTDVHNSGRFPEEFWADLADRGWLGTAVSEEFGGEGFGVKQILPIVEEVALTGGFSIANAFLYTPIFGGITMEQFGSDEQKHTWLPRIVDGEAQFAIAVTEPDAGINTTNIDTTATREGGEYVLDGTKIWVSNFDYADRVLVLARTTPKDAVDRPSLGLTVFLVDPEADDLQADKLEHDGWMPEATYNVYFDGLRLPESAIVGTEDRGLHQFFGTLNAERILLAASMYTTGLYALQKAGDYAAERTVFGETPIGEYQGVQHPLADAYADVQSARLMSHRAAWLFDSEDSTADTAANIANLQAGKAGWNAVDAASAAFGGMSMSSDVELTKMQSMVRHQRIVPIPEEMLRNYIAENELGLPRSY